MSLPEFPADASRYPEASQATTALALGIVGLFVNFLAPFAWWVGQRELGAIDAGRRSPHNRGTANVGKILGIIGTVLLAFSILVIALFFGMAPMFFFSL
jgi:Mg/Co/Ni transporter MgtE